MIRRGYSGVIPKFSSIKINDPRFFHEWYEGLHIENPTKLRAVHTKHIHIIQAHPGDVLSMMLDEPYTGQLINMQEQFLS